jgi:hypothetical protein
MNHGHGNINIRVNFPGGTHNQSSATGTDFSRKMTIDTEHRFKGRFTGQLCTAANKAAERAFLDFAR